jgi:hypothetical protein
LVLAKFAEAVQAFVAPDFRVTFVVPRARTVDAFVVKLMTIVYVVCFALGLVTVPVAVQPLEVCLQALAVTALRATGWFTIVVEPGLDVTEPPPAPAVVPPAADEPVPVALDEPEEVQPAVTSVRAPASATAARAGPRERAR